MRKKTLAFILLILLSPCLASAANEEGMKAWQVKEMAMANLEKVELRDERQKILKTIDGKQLAALYAVEIAIEQAADLHADFYLVAGDDPNAFATLGKNDEYLIAFTFGMLDMVGMDVDAAAAIMGHELAHLKLNHIEEKKEAQKKTSNNTMFSAAATKYTRDNEREADYLGMIWTVEAGYDPEGAVRVHEQLYKLSKKRAGGFSGSHPSSIERLTVLKSLVRRLSK